MAIILTSIFILGFFAKMTNTQVSSSARPIKQLPEYREVNWCVTGQDEPELHEYPFQQFTPLLRRDRRYMIDPKYRYSIEFYEVFSRMPINTEATCNATVPEPWCLNYDCGPNEIFCRQPRKYYEHLKYIGRLFKTVHVIVKAEIRRDPSLGVNEVWQPNPLEGLILQASHNPKGVGLPTGQFFIEEDYTCNDCNRSSWGQAIPCRKRSVTQAVHPTILIFHHRMNQIDESQNWVVAGKRSEIHANFRWYSPPCLETRRMEFNLMAVHDFKENIFDVVNLGPYEVFGRGQQYHSDSIPTPIFTGFFYHQKLLGTWCHATSSRDIQVVHPPVFRKFEMSPGFDECVRNELNPRKVEIGDTMTEVFRYTCYTPSQPLCVLDAKDDKLAEYAYFLQQASLPCAEVCPTPETTTTTTTTIGPPPLIKRHYHGGVLIMTNFCLMPINTFIARFYKETLNLENYKGVKVWFWWHLLGSMGSCIMIYFGTFQAGPDSDSTYHVYLGQSYILVLATCYFSAWGRHLNKWINQTLEFVHGSLGYFVILLAHITMHTAPGVGFVPKLLVDLQIGLHVLFMFVMTFHICRLDSKFGMRPRRRHFPTVEACFDDIPIPKNTFRMVLLFILASITFICSIIALFVQ